jgi:hypothetical protein
MAEVDFSQSYYLKRAAALGISSSLFTEIIPRTKQHAMRRNIVTDGNRVHISRSRRDDGGSGVTIFPASQSDKHRGATKSKTVHSALPRIAGATPSRKSNRLNKLRDWEKDGDDDADTRFLISPITHTGETPNTSHKTKRKNREHSLPPRRGDGRNSVSPSHGSAEASGSKGDVAIQEVSMKASGFVAREGKLWMIVTEKMMEVFTP